MEQQFRENSALVSHAEQIWSDIVDWGSLLRQVAHIQYWYRKWNEMKQLCLNFLISKKTEKVSYLQGYEKQKQYIKQIYK